MKGKRWELPQKFRTIYWQNFALTASIVMLTLALLGASFFALSYAYAADERSDEMAQKASVVARLVASYASSGDVRDMREMAGVAASMTDVDFLVCSTEGSVLLTTDENLVDHVLTVPSDVMETALSGERYSARTTLGGIYESKRFVVGVPIESDIWTVGAVFAVTETGRLTTMWRAFFAMFLMTSVIVLLLSFVASAWVSMRQSRPIREMAAATRAFAEGNFDTRMHDYGAGEIGELASAFNAMADSLQETERQRREFIANISHELKTPMTSIIGYADLLRSQVLTPDEQMDAANYIFSEGKRLERLSLKLLELYLAEHQALSLVPVAPADLLQDLTAHLSPGLARQGIVLTTQWEPGLCLLEPDLFRSLVLNLIDNSRKAIGAQGTISISCQMTERGCRLTVQDTGRGMPPEVLSHLTEAFYRVDKSRARAQGGAGLGLALCEKIAVLHQGRITFESTLGQGTTVTVSLEGGRP